MVRSVLLIFVLGISGSAAIAPDAMPWDFTSPDSVVRRLSLHVFSLLASLPLMLSIQASYSRKITALVGLEVLVSWGAAMLHLSFIASTVIYFQTWRENLLAIQTFGNAEVYEVDAKLFLKGVIGTETARAVKLKMQKSSPHTLVLSSPGGMIDPAVEIAQLVKDNSIPVHVIDSCASACVIIAAASSNLTAQRKAVFGFHRGSAVVTANDSWTRFVSESAADELITILRSHGIPEDILVFAKETPPEEMHWISSGELQARGIVTQITD